MKKVSSDRYSTVCLHSATSAIVNNFVGCVVEDVSAENLNDLNQNLVDPDTNIRHLLCSQTISYCNLFSEHFSGKNWKEGVGYWLLSSFK